MLDERKQRICEGLNAADIARAEAAQAQANIEEQLTVARKEGQDIVANAQAIGTRLQAEAREQAARDAKRRSSGLAPRSTRTRPRDSRASARIRDITVSAAEKVIGQSLDRQRSPADHRRSAGRVDVQRQLGWRTSRRRSGTRRRRWVSLSRPTRCAVACRPGRDRDRSRRVRLAGVLADGKLPVDQRVAMVTGC